ncbi:MAG: hypothetical protein QG602_2478 [Verrucomicrobiota bacterium]|nr:hypothetical protein [Verrucomicrobiota bacterium]
MSNRPTSVCIDNVDSFFSLIESALRTQDFLDEIRRQCRADEDSFRHCWRWLESRDRTSLIAKAAYNCLLDELSAVVTHVHAFHGCRVYADSTYHIEGIKPLTDEWITAEVRKWAGTIPASESDAGRLLQDYIRDYGGKVCAVKSLKAHQDKGGYGHALGSEALRKILNLHCPSGLERMLQTGEPSIIEFTIPVAELENKAWPNFVSDLLRIWLARQVGYPWPNDPRHGGIVLSRLVPPNWLLCRHICDSCGILTGRISEY